MNLLISAFAGLLFGLGLVVSGMGNPAKVQAFLDLGGAWDPSLMLVMGGAIAVALPAFRLVAGRSLSFRARPLHLPSARAIDLPLVGGSLIFGIGWGLAGICPGPAFVLLGTGVPGGWIFFAGLVAGMAVFELLRRRFATPRD